MSFFKNIFDYINSRTRIDFSQFVNVRRAKLEAEGFPTDHVNWEHYARVLEAKQDQLKAE